MTEKRIAPYPVRMPDELRKALEKKAKEKKISFHKYVLGLLMQNSGVILLDHEENRMREIVTEELEKHKLI